MVEITATIATTRPFKQGNAKIGSAKKVIDSFADQVNGEWSLPFGVEHDPFCMPIGKLKKAWVEPFEDEYAAIACIYVEDDEQRTIHTTSGTELVHLKFEKAPKPFIRQFNNPDQGLMVLGVDSANFKGSQDLAMFKNAVDQIDDSITHVNLGRHSLGPEPLIQIVVANLDICAALTVGCWVLKRVEKFFRYTIDETLKKIADEISESLSAKILQILSVYKNRRMHDERPIVIEVVIPGETDLILLTKIEPHEDFPRINLETLTTEMEKYGDLLQNAAEVTFARTGNDDWEFQHLKTRTGEVFGSIGCYRRTCELLNRTGKRPESEN